MPIASSASTSKRLLALLSLLQSRRDWPAPVLAERLAVSERTVRRDVDRLRELDYAIDATRGPDGGYRLGVGAHLPPLLLDDEQAVAIAISLQTAGALGADIEEAAERALRTISRTMPTHLARRIDGLALAVSTPANLQSRAVDPETLLRIGRAISRSEELRFDYASPNGAESADGAQVRRTEPHHLLLHVGLWYLMGWTAEREDWRIYRVDRISPRSHNGRSFVPRGVPGGDPAAYLAARFKGSTSSDTWPCWGEVILRASISEVAPYIGDGTAEPLGDSRCRVRLGAWSWAGLAATIGRFDADIEVIGPPELARAFATLAQRFATAGKPASVHRLDG